MCSQTTLALVSEAHGLVFYRLFLYRDVRYNLVHTYAAAASACFFLFLFLRAAVLINGVRISFICAEI